ncbi:enoyl-CoA hydratase [Alcanivorax hongdengensis A-11-3]|uniref:Enoyl-CoA hydratase n=1 Tax=Alcanivorax hongdengensis A-11-3 TaxID=1177179 RepID=L0WG30_9GAMM|nr:enoyl-CoA hydratase-related protein [Alcanivorax hongdengensis]EKF75956.1 enoyl-CoA hydratase [Alcanivorax hongdengensis A-11-3]
MPALESGQIVAENKGAVLEITFDRADKLNAFTSAMYRDLVKLLDHAEHSEALRVVFFRGEGRAFSAGNDLADFLNAKPGEAGEAAHFIKAIYRFPKALVAAVQGNAVGVGTTMLLHTDLVVAADDAKFLTPFVDLGAVPEAGSAKLLPAWLGYQRAARMLLLGEPMLAQEALEAGLVAKVVPTDQVQQTASEWAQTLAKKPPRALRESKRLMRSGISRGLDDILNEDLALFGEMLQSDEAKAVLTAMHKR